MQAPMCKLKLVLVDGASKHGEQSDSVLVFSAKLESISLTLRHRPTRLSLLRTVSVGIKTNNMMRVHELTQWKWLAEKRTT